MAALVALVLLPAAEAGAQATPFAPYDGSNPFNCELQDVGTGTDFPHPEADPFCVRFDKTSQNITDFGIVDFLTNEPARVAGAGDKCFYYQRDHWTGSVVQGQPPELWNWVGGYFFDKAKGVGGVSVRDFRLLGEPGDMTPYVPAAYAPYFDADGGGGVLVTEYADSVDPTCAAKVDTPEEAEHVYGHQPAYRDCIPPGGELEGRRVGAVRLGMKPKSVRKRLGRPGSRKRGVDRWCVIGGASLRVAYHRGSPRGVALIRTSSRGHSEGGVAPGDRRSRAERKLALEPRFEVGKTDVTEGPRHAGRRLFVGLSRRRVRWLAMVDPERIQGDDAARRALLRAR